VTGLVVAGAAGRMGREVVRAVLANAGARLSGGFDRPDHEALGQDLGLLAGAGPAGVKLVDSLAEAAHDGRVIIDFSTPAGTLATARAAQPLGLAQVIGTTGLKPGEVAELREMAQTRPILLAPNMSVGLNVLLRLVAEAVRLLGPAYDVEILEAHHRMKVDAPSGTALALGRAAAQARGVELETVGVMASQGQVGPRTDAEIGLQAVRAGDIVGEHTVFLAGPGERLELIHRCHSRSTLAQGAIRAALWLAGQGPGWYDLRDVLGLR
jgi:4-hydroxy-tetrahydrodipicolinate reductase